MLLPPNPRILVPKTAMTDTRATVMIVTDIVTVAGSAIGTEDNVTGAGIE